MKILLITLFTISFVYSQEKISNKDLRGEKEMMKILGKKIDLKVLKSRNDSFSYIINNRAKFKLANESFNEIDKVFAKDFINMKYMMKEMPKKCKKYYEVFIRNESLSICKSENEKIRIVQSLVNKIKSLK